MKLFIITDLEGCAGVVSRNQLSGTTACADRARRILAGEINAAVASAFENGFKEVVVWSGHVSPDDLPWDELDPRPHYLIGSSILPVLDRSFDGLGLIGQHAMRGSGGVLEHTYDTNNYYSLALNGKLLGEAGMIAAVAGTLGVPVLFLSGDDVCCQEIAKLIPHAAVAPVKQALGYQAAQTLHPKAAQQAISSAVKDGIVRRKKIAPFKIGHPVEMVIEYTSAAPVQRNILVPGIQLAGPRAIRYKGKNAIEAYKMFELLARIV